MFYSLAICATSLSPESGACWVLSVVFHVQTFPNSGPIFFSQLPLDYCGLVIYSLIPLADSSA